MLTEILSQAADLLALAPTPEPAQPAPTGINTDGIVNFFGMKIAPVLVAVVGVVVLGRANRGQVSQTLTSSAITMVGVGMIAGATAWFAIGPGLVDVIFQ